MPTYAIGDVQGCLPPLLQLLDKINYEPTRDHLWFTGDLVNRGYHSLATLRFIKSLPHTVIVLGNHDLALLAINHGSVNKHPKDTFDEILTAPDKDELLNWLKQQVFLHHDPMLGYALSHAGIYPLWDFALAQDLAKELQDCLQGSLCDEYLSHLFGNEPSIWDDDLKGWERKRFITNAFTRMRFCKQSGELDLKAKGNPVLHPELIPWYAFPTRKACKDRLIFGHWAALNAQNVSEDIIPLDSGCVWGNCLTAFCLETKQKVTVDCKDYIDQPLLLGGDPR